jgi:hypothetical protein
VVAETMEYGTAVAGWHGVVYRVRRAWTG